MWLTDCKTYHCTKHRPIQHIVWLSSLCVISADAFYTPRPSSSSGNTCDEQTATVYIVQDIDRLSILFDFVRCVSFRPLRYKPRALYLVANSTCDLQTATRFVVIETNRRTILFDFVCWVTRVLQLLADSTCDLQTATRFVVIETNRRTVSFVWFRS